MEKRNSKIWVPVIGLDGFRKEQTAGREELLFNELHGERLIEKPHKHDFFIINLFHKASGVHTIDSIDYRIKDHQVHILFPGQMHKWHIYADTIAYQLMIERPLFEHFAPFFRFSFTNYQNHPVIDLTADSFAQLLYEFESVKQELKRENSLIPLISARAGVIAAIVSREAESAFTEFKVYQSVPRLAKFNMLIDEFFREQKMVAFYAEKLNISPNYLNILCKKHLKISATQLIHQRINIEAKRLLQSSERSIKEIAFELGFADQAYFSNFFKLQIGTSPSDFRDNRQAGETISLLRGK
ncbi:MULTISPECIES: AraC family transcriptional regulator [unclassified Sphingobacterium]|uniref:helix-turn-helix domain-containing protein n=1 Tax=unclassified Sphingobacterium TaxID=2609468 RepID=UPI0025DB9F5F|nr:MULTISPECIES: helix-turn-helix transcriptional regulator [unclassified Sphingobacterium]MDR6733687.1 AraC-like DNA-binding protein [Sphingobacterium sp. 2149]